MQSSQQALLCIPFWLNCLSVPISPNFFVTFAQRPHSFIVPRLFEEKRRDIVFGFPSFRLSVPLKYYVPCVRNSSYSVMPIHLKLYRCFCHGLKICIWFGYYPEIIFCHFFRSLNLAIFLGVFTNKVNR